MDVIGVTSCLVMYTIVIAAVIQDFCVMKISNRLILIGLCVALVFRFLCEGPVAIVHFLVNITFPVVVLYLIYLMGIIGAGDIKLFSVIGGFVNLKELVLCIAMAFVVGAVISFLKMMKEKNFKESMYHGVAYLLSVFSGQMEAYDTKQLSNKNLIHFSLAILIALWYVKELM